MVSATQQTSRIRARKARKNGVPTKRFARAHGTPAFPIHLEGYDPKAADAKPASTAGADLKAGDVKGGDVHGGDAKAADTKASAKAAAKPKAAPTTKKK